ncbi:MAG TPA: hypothetical protein VGF24_31850 [Vicinamibacterales bacterium]|jgi:hypothetical protein
MPPFVPSDLFRARRIGVGAPALLSPPSRPSDVAELVLASIHYHNRETGDELIYQDHELSTVMAHRPFDGHTLVKPPTQNQRPSAPN